MIKGEQLYSGKAKTVYATNDPKRYIVKFRDDVTAGDGARKANMKGKGYYNAQISARLFKLLADNGISTHFIKMVSEDEMLVHACDMIKIEVIPRNLAAGSIVRKYEFRQGQPFEKPIIVMDYKNDAAHDPMLNDDIAIALGLVTEKELRKIRKISLRVNEILLQYLGERGLDRQTSSWSSARLTRKSSSRTRYRRTRCACGRRAPWKASTGRVPAGQGRPDHLP
jgi:phosphoribosylaminoimidazole-succinocarboxamide synthase